MEIIKEAGGSKIICHTVEMPASVRSFHWHENIEICQVLQNPCSFLIDGLSVDAQPGDLIAVDACAVHRFFIHTDHTRIRICQFPAHLLLQSHSPVQPLQLHIPREEIQRIPGLSASLESIFSMMEAEGRLEKHESNPFLQVLAPALYFLLMRHFSQDGPLGGSGPRMEFFKIAEYISTHLDAPLTVQSIAIALYIPRGRLNAIFSKYAGISLLEYINSLRIQKANALLDQGRTVTAAALESGFQCIRTFNSTYKRLTGITPSEHLQHKL